MTQYPNDDDGESLRQVAAAGSDMSRPMPIDYMIDVPDEAAGKRVAADAAKLGYSTNVELDDELDAWTCYCTKTMRLARLGQR